MDNDSKPGPAAIVHPAHEIIPSDASGSDAAVVMNGIQEAVKAMSATRIAEIEADKQVSMQADANAHKQRMAVLIGAFAVCSGVATVCFLTGHVDLGVAVSTLCIGGALGLLGGGKAS